MARFARLAPVFLAVSLLAACTEQAGGELGDLFKGAPAELETLPAPAGLTPSERAAWNAMSPAKQHEARAFIDGGGTFAEFLAV